MNMNLILQEFKVITQVFMTYGLTLIFRHPGKMQHLCWDTTESNDVQTRTESFSESPKSCNRAGHEKAQGLFWEDGQLNVRARVTIVLGEPE
jgi:hypothetical protein